MMNYQQEALRTKSDNFNLTPQLATDLMKVCQGAVLSGRGGDAVKRSIFYLQERKHLHDIDSSDLNGVNVHDPQFTGLDPDLVHGILGLYTEACELMELLLTSLISGQKIEPDKLVKELGDVYWYGAVVQEGLGVTEEHVKRMNILKLKTRYPDKFTVEDAVARVDA
jgi:hypothetical protein